MEAKNFSTGGDNLQYEDAPSQVEFLIDEEVHERTQRVRQRFNNLIYTEGADGNFQIDATMLPIEQVTETLVDGTPGTCKVNASQWVTASSTEDGGMIALGMVTYRDQVIEDVEAGGKSVRVTTNLFRPPIPAVYYRVFDASGNLIDQQESFRVTPEDGVVSNGTTITHEEARWEHVEAVLDTFEAWYEQQTTRQWTAPERLKMMSDSFTEMFKSFITVCESTNFKDVTAALRNSQHAQLFANYEEWVDQLRTESMRLNDQHTQSIALDAIHGVLINAGFNDPEFVESTLTILETLKADAEERHFDDLLPSLEEKIDTLRSLA